MKSVKNDIHAVGFLAAFALACVIAGMVLALLSHWLAGAFYRMGAKEAPSEWLAYIVTALIGVVVVAAIMERITEDRWPWG